MLRKLTLLGDGLGNALGLATLKLSCQQIAKPTLQQRHNSSEEEEPNPPHGSPEPYTWTLAHRPCIESVVDQVLDILQRRKDSACSQTQESMHDNGHQALLQLLQIEHCLLTQCTIVNIH